MQGFADDGVILIIGKVVCTLCEIMQRMLHGVEKWCTDRQLSVNPSKTEIHGHISTKKLVRICPVQFEITVGSLHSDPHDFNSQHSWHPACTYFVVAQNVCNNIMCYFR